jgi:hypothetical protein
MEVPGYLTVLVVGTSVTVVVAIVAILRANPVLHDRPAVDWGVGVVLAAWLIATALAARAGAYRSSPDAPLPGVAVPLLLGILVPWVATLTIPALRSGLEDPLTQARLVTVQVWRVVGVAFLVLFALDKLPAAFALPAGLGDIVTGIAAPFVARGLDDPLGRRWAFAWNVFGLADLIAAIVLGSVASIGPVHLLHTTPTTTVMTRLPMALIPTFLVPLSMVLHFISFRYLRMRRRQESTVATLERSTV